jgi:hypothetical protein
MDRHQRPRRRHARYVSPLECLYARSFNRSSVTLIGEAVFSRCLSAIKEERVRASKVISGPQKEAFRGDKKQFIDDLEQALYASKIISYTQGFMLMRQTAKDVSYLISHQRPFIDTDIPAAQLEPELCWHCPHVARWLHHQGEISTAFPK